MPVTYAIATNYTGPIAEFQGSVVDHATDYTGIVYAIALPHGSVVDLPANMIRVTKGVYEFKIGIELYKKMFRVGTFCGLKEHLTKIAKKKYYKHNIKAELEEEFYQEFMTNGRSWNAKLYDKWSRPGELIPTLIALRGEAELCEKNVTDYDNRM